MTTDAVNELVSRRLRLDAPRLALWAQGPVVASQQAHVYCTSHTAYCTYSNTLATLPLPVR